MPGHVITRSFTRLRFCSLIIKRYKVIQESVPILSYPIIKLSPVKSWQNTSAAGFAKHLDLILQEAIHQTVFVESISWQAYDIIQILFIPLSQLN